MRLLIGAVLMAVAAASAGAVRAGLFSGPLALTHSVAPADAPPFAIGGPRSGMKPGASRVVASFKAANGQSHQAVLGLSGDSSKLCLLDVNLDTHDENGGCNPSSDFFGGGHELMISLSFDGGPALRSVRNARIVGIVSSEVASVAVLDSAGAITPVALTADRAFAFITGASDLARGIEPEAVIAYDASGHEIDRQQTGITH
jgi:hypothetical protein